MATPSVLIVGAGIGGLTLAHALRQLGLTNVQVAERAPQIAPVGAGIWVGPNAMQVMQHLGLAQKMEEAGLPLDGIELVRHTGKMILSIPMGPVRERFGQTTVSILRAKQHAILRESLPDEALLLGKECVGVSQPGGADSQAKVQFADGDELVADVVVGADGAHSVVRAAVQPGVKLRVSSDACYRGLADYTLSRPRVCGEYWGGPYRFGYSSVSMEQVYWYCTIVKNKQPDPSLTGEALHRELVARFAEFPEEVRKTLEHTPPSSLMQTPLADLPPGTMRRWHAGRVVLLGDAAHATTPNLGQGGGQAIESAWSLARELAKTPDDVQGAFARYETARKPKANFIVRQSARIGRVVHIRNRLFNAMFDFATRMSKGTNKRVLNRIYTIEDK